MLFVPDYRIWSTNLVSHLMSQYSTSPDLAKLSTDLDRAVSRARAGAIAIALLSIVSVGLVAYWLGHARTEFTRTISPEIGADLAVAKLTEAMPTVVPQLKSQVIAYAPTLMDAAEARLMSMPDEFADHLVARTTAELDRVMPDAEEQLYLSLRTALDAARSNPAVGITDEKRALQFVDALADVYTRETEKLLDTVHARYTAGGDMLAYLDHLATGKNLDRKQQLQRQALVTFLTIASRAKSAAATAE